MKKISKSNIICITISILIYIYSFFTTNYYFKFSYNEFNMLTWFRYLFIRLSFIALDFSLVIFLKNKILKLIKKDKSTQRLLILFLISFSVNMIFLLLMWPGNWINDEIGVLYNAQTFTYYSWQNYLSVIFYSLCLMVFPSAISIPIIQVIFISYAFAYFINYVYERTNTKWVYLLFLILLLPPVIYNNLYPLRLTMVYKKYKNKEKLNWKDIILIAVNIFILSFWRTEGIYYLVLPIIVYFLFKDTKKIIPKCIIIEVVAISLVGVFTYIDKYYDYKAYVKYKLTAIINPLSILLQKDLNGNVNESIEKIDQVIDVNLLKENPLYWNILIALDDSKGLYRENITENYDGVMPAYLKIILNNFPEFIKERIEVFNITNGNYELENNYYSLNGRSDFENGTKDLIQADVFGKAISNNLRNEFIKFLRGEKIKFVKLFYNVKPVLFAICILLIILLIKKKIVESLLILNLIAKSALVFLTTPASFFMYYYPLYLEGSLLVSLFIIILIRKGIQKWKK